MKKEKASKNLHKLTGDAVRGGVHGGAKDRKENLVKSPIKEK